MKILHIIIVLHIVLFFLFREEALSLWTLLPYGTGVLMGNYLQDIYNDFFVLVRRGKNRAGT